MRECISSRWIRCVFFCVFQLRTLTERAKRTKELKNVWLYVIHIIHFTRIQTLPNKPLLLLLVLLLSSLAARTCLFVCIVYFASAAASGAFRPATLSHACVYVYSILDAIVVVVVVMWCVWFRSLVPSVACVFNCRCIVSVCVWALELDVVRAYNSKSFAACHSASETQIMPCMSFFLLLLTVESHAWNWSSIHITSPNGRSRHQQCYTIVHPYNDTVETGTVTQRPYILSINPM